jgi:DNA uptake protein ComE-like DNA-binding protein
MNRKLSLCVAFLSVVLIPLVGGTANAQLGRQQGLIEPNLATQQQLLTLPHMTAALAKQITDQRPFQGMRDLNSLLGRSLTKDQLKDLYGKLFLHINLNTASADDIMLIPSMTARMTHEFEEYRPYKSLDQFRREIVKYVDAKEVARLEQYVFIPISLNNASDADIMTIPGMTPRMTREFKEYRPYDNIQKFRREIGKYVDAKEVARLERYVTL